MFIPAGRKYESCYLSDHLGNVRVVARPYGRAAQRVQEDHYYPFGLLMPYTRYASSTSTINRLLYNGKELQDEIPGLRCYDYGARFYDPQIGRWHSVDPLAEKYPFLSPYAYCNNNPIRFVDPDGCEFTDDAWKWVNKLIDEVNSRQASHNAKIAEKQAKIDAGGLSARQEKRLNRQIENLKSQNTDLERVRGEVATLAASDQVYNVVESSSQNEPGIEIAYTSFNYSTKALDITISPGAGLGLFSHELRHAYQFDQGLASFGAPQTMGGSFLLDKTDELAGYMRQGMFGSNEGITSINNLPARYKSLPNGPVDVNNFSFQGKKLTDMNQYELKHLSKIMNQAFRYNGKTYY